MAAHGKSVLPPSEAADSRQAFAPAEKAAPIVTAAPVPEGDESGAAHQQMPTSPTHETPAVSEYGESEAPSAYRPDTQEREEAHEEFSRFDQGPLVNVPEFVPAAPAGLDDDDEAATPSVPRYRREPSEYMSAQPRAPVSQHASIYATPLDAASGRGSSTVYAEDGEQSETQRSEANLDRWAQIRRNAAERAARQSEEQSTRSQSQSMMTQGTEGDETSGEESKSDAIFGRFQ